jgi:hypothetical protein
MKDAVISPFKLILSLHGMLHFRGLLMIHLIFHQNVYCCLIAWCENMVSNKLPICLYYRIAYENKHAWHAQNLD